MDKDMLHLANKAAVVLYYLPFQCLTVAAAAAAADQAPLEAAVGIFSESTLRAWAVIGAVLGSMLSVAIAPPKPESTTAELLRSLLFKGVASISGGIIFTPIAFKYTALEVTVDMVLSVSGVMSFLTTSILHRLVPVIERAVAARIGGPNP